MNGLFLVGSSGATHFNWLIGEQFNVHEGLEFTPSTVVGGSDFNTPVMVLKQSGNVGIGTASPGAKLEVVSSDSTVAQFIRPSAGPQIKLGANSTTNYATWTYILNTDSAALGTASDYKTLVIQNGNVGIGTVLPPQSKLAVNGTITATEIKVTESGWADFVFNDDYSLQPLESVESYIKEHKRLPDIPSAEKVEKEGIAVSEMLAKQMQKIEELTLYVIELKKENTSLKAELENRIAAIENSIGSSN